MGWQNSMCQRQLLGPGAGLCVTPQQPLFVVLPALCTSAALGLRVFEQ